MHDLQKKVPWPPDLDWILQKLKPVSFSRVVAFPRTPDPAVAEAPGVPGLSGEVALDAREWKMIEAMSKLGAIFTTDEQILTFWREPEVRLEIYPRAGKKMHIVRLHMLAHAAATTPAQS